MDSIRGAARQAEEHPDRAPLMVVRPDGSDAHPILEVDGMRPRYIDWGPGPS